MDQLVDPFLAFVENGALGTFIRETPSVFVFPTIITLHTIGMGFLAGGSIAIDLRILGFAPKMALAPIGRFFPVLWLALVVNAVSGVLLLIAYPTKALTNPLFYVKLLLIAAAVLLLYRIKVRIFDHPKVERMPIERGDKRLAVISIAIWLAVIAAGRLLAYTYRWEMLGIPAIT
jgi:uncharacterized membrane protein